MSALIERLAREYAAKAVEHVPPAYDTFIRERIEDALHAFQVEAARVACTGCYQPMFYGHGKPDCPVPKIEAL